MTMKTELDELVIRAYEGTLSRDPAVPRGAVVAGEKRGLTRKSTYTPDFGTRIRGIFAGESNPHREGYYVETIRRTGRFNRGEFYRLTDGAGSFWEYPAANVVILLEDGLTMERIRALEEELEQARLRNGDLLGKVTRLEARLEEVRPVVRAAIADDPLARSTLSSATRKWAEGHGEEETR